LCVRGQWSLGVPRHPEVPDGTFELGEDEAVSLISIGVDFGVTQVAGGNWGVHAIVRQKMFAGG